MDNVFKLFSVSYVDDNNIKHLTFVKTLSEVRFIQDRFDRVSYEPMTSELSLAL